MLQLPLRSERTHAGLHCFVVKNTSPTSFPASWQAPIITTIGYQHRAAHGTPILTAGVDTRPRPPAPSTLQHLSRTDQLTSNMVSCEVDSQDSYCGKTRWRWHWHSSTNPKRQTQSLAAVMLGGYHLIIHVS